MEEIVDHIPPNVIKTSNGYIKIEYDLDGAKIFSEHFFNGTCREELYALASNILIQQANSLDDNTQGDLYE